MSGAKFTANPGFEAALLRSGFVAAALEVEAKALAADAARRAPRLSGRLADSIEGGTRLTERGFVGVVVVRDFKALWVENGTRRTRAHPYLRPAIRARRLRYMVRPRRA